jgi:hypothetical protein
MFKSGLLLISIVFAIFCYHTSYAQVSNRIVDTNKRWSILAYGFRDGDPNRKFCRESSYIKFKGDSLIDSTLYKKIYEAPDSLAENWFLKGCIREKNKKVYGRTLDNDQEYLMYDFGVESNDTIYISDPFSSVYNLKMVINEIDSISLINTKKKRIKVSFHDGKETWIEGIGSMDGIVERTLNLVGGYKELLCFMENNTLQYKNPDYSKCYYQEGVQLSIERAEGRMDIRIYPNPARNYVYISHGEIFLELKQLTFKMYNLNWQPIEEQRIDLNEPAYINLSHIRPGAYIYMIYSENNLYKTGKLIKQ